MSDSSLKGLYFSRCIVFFYRNSFPKEHAVALKDMLMDLTGKAIANGRSKVILRKLYAAVSVYIIITLWVAFLKFVQLSQLALKLHPTRPSQWPDWILATVTYISGHGVSPELLLEFLAIVPEEIRTSDLITTTKCVRVRPLWRVCFIMPQLVECR